MSKHRINLNDNQIHILQLIYKFRFVTVPLLTEHRQVDRAATKRTLKILLDREYIGRRYDKSYKLQGRPASYYLTKKAIRLLRDDYELNEGVLHTLYKNTVVGEPFVQQFLDIYTAYQNLHKLYPETFDVFTRAELADYDYFPEPSPNLYLKRRNALDNSPNEYMLDLFTNTHLFVIKKRIDVYIEHFESDGWEENIYPSILIVCSNTQTERSIQKYIEQALDNNFIEDNDVQFLTSTTKALLDSNNTNKKIWSNPINPKVLTGL